MDGATNRRRRRGSTLLSKVSESGETADSRKRCKFCRGFFTPNPNQARHDFCRDECRKNFHKYGALPLAKLKADLTREFARLIAAELAPLRTRLDKLERAFMDSLKVETPSGWADPESGEPANIDWPAIDAADAEFRARVRAKRGGATA